LAVYILLGAQGSGKSTWAQVNARRLRATLLASDDVRNQLEAAGDDPTNGDRVFAIVEAELANRLAQGQNVIVDATHARRSWRRQEIDIGRQHGARVVGVWFDRPLEHCLAMNSRRPGGGWGSRVVPEAMVRWVWEGFEAPTPGEFDEVWRIVGESAAK
jgi:predicted kinase